MLGKRDGREQMLDIALQRVLWEGTATHEVSARDHSLVAHSVLRPAYCIPHLAFGNSVRALVGYRVVLRAACNWKGGAPCRQSPLRF
jgi:hypothetical protein